MKKIFGLNQKFIISHQILPTCLPLLACLIQLILWPFLKGLTWILFYPAIFFAGWLGGFFSGIFATAFSMGLGWFFFIPPEQTLLKASFSAILSTSIFALMGVMISFLHGRIKKTEQELREKNKTLEQAFEGLQLARDEVEVSNRKLQNVNREVKRLYEKTLELDKLKTQFFANVSHELRTPLTLILGYVELLLSKGPNPESKGILEIVRRNAYTLLKQVNDLLDVARLEAGKAETTYSEIDLSKLLRQIASNFGSIALERKITFSIETPDTLIAQVDPVKFEQILLNLLSNAFKFTPDAGTIRCTLRIIPETQRAMIEIADNGPGIPEQYREVIFERFFQIEESSIRRFGGTGLGLAIVKDFVALQGGTVKISKAPEGGALFTVEIPVKAPDGVWVRKHAPAHVETPIPVIAEPVPPLRLDKSKRIISLKPVSSPIESGMIKPLVLVVEDTSDMRDYICEILKPDFEIETAKNGREGLEKTWKICPDLIVSDIMMPEMSGDEMFRKIRASPEMEMIPIILLSAKADDKLRIELLREGAQDYLLKPFVPEELKSKVRNLLTVKAAEAKFRGLMESAQDAIVVVGSNRNIKFANHQTSSWFGYSREELIGKPIETLVPDIGRSIYVGNRNQYAQIPKANHRSERIVELRGLRKNGSEFPVSITLSPMQTLEGLLITAIIRDISEMKKLSEQAIRAREEAIATVSHDLKNPLAAIQMNTQLLLSKRELFQREALFEKTLTTIQRASNQMTSLIQDLLDYSKTEAHRLVVEKKHEDVSSILAEIFDIFEQPAKEKSIILQQQIGTGLYTVDCERDRIIRVLSNLVNNAIKFTPRGGKITVTAKLNNGDVLFSVQNTGQGIPPNRLPHIFERYWQAEETARKGTGLGLAIAKGFVEAHQGRIWVESHENGSTFYFTLPGNEKIAKLV